MATNEKITLNVDLYDNIMTEQKGDYTGRARITGSLHNKEIAARIIKERTEYRQETIENILDLADQKKVEAIAEGKSVVDGVGQYIVTVRGSFLGENAQFHEALARCVLHTGTTAARPAQSRKSNLQRAGTDGAGHQLHHRLRDEEYQPGHHFRRSCRYQRKQH